MPAALLYGDTVRYPALRHEIPLEIIDALLFVDTGGAAHVLTSSLEAARLHAALPEAELSLFEELGLFELVRQGMARDQAERMTVMRALEQWGVDSVVVPADLPVAVADAICAAGIELTVDSKAIEARRRVKSTAELEGIRRAQRAAEAGMAAGEALIHGAQARDGVLHRAGLRAIACRPADRDRPVAA